MTYEKPCRTAACHICRILFLSGIICGNTFCVVCRYLIIAAQPPPGASLIFILSRAETFLVSFL